MLTLITHTSCVIFCAVVLSPLSVFLCSAVLPVKSQSSDALGFAAVLSSSAEVSSPHLVLHKCALHPSGLRYGSGGKNPPKPRLLGVTSLSGVQSIFLGNMRKKHMENLSVVC